MARPICIQLVLIANAVLGELSDFDLELTCALGHLCRIQHGMSALIGRRIGTDRLSRARENPVLDSCELPTFGFQLGLGPRDPGAEHVQVMAGLERIEDGPLRLGRAATSIAAATRAEVVAVDGLAELAQPLPAALLIQPQISAHSIFRARLAVLRNMIAGIACHTVLVTD